MVPRSDTFRWTFENLVRNASLAAAIMTSCAQPVIGSQASIAPALQLGGVPGVHTPDWQVSSPLQTLASAHDVPFATGVRRQPALGSQVSVVQGLLSAQLTGVPGRQTPARQTSTPLQRLPSLHEVPFGAAVCLQPAIGSQVSVVHVFPSLQLSAAPAVHTPAWHVSAPSHTLPSLHEVPFASAVCLQPATGSQVSVVQGF